MLKKTHRAGWGLAELPSLCQHVKVTILYSLTPFHYLPFHSPRSPRLWCFLPQAVSRLAMSSIARTLVLFRVFGSLPLRTGAATTLWGLLNFRLFLTAVGEATVASSVSVLTIFSPEFCVPFTLDDVPAAPFECVWKPSWRFPAASLFALNSMLRSV